MNDVYEHVRQSSQQVSEKMKTRYDRKLNNLGFDEGSLEEQSTSSGGNEELKENQNPQADDQSQTVNTNATEVSTIRRRKHPTELFQAEKVMKEALSTFNATVKRNTPQPIPKEDDDCDLYAKLLATKLRKLPERKRLRFRLLSFCSVSPVACARDRRNLFETYGGFHCGACGRSRFSTRPTGANA
ncbi:Uncharacterized protein OBRU01_18864 [Operophtera brumata]|uniref:Uncharacterized protein n=1 Tax=Operophtera brumata TaxID=104452 RepID=A0A0L7KY42_OPEBR|nr:Uncharacterized protein OBRU01_18864 [Operophtera brumata]